jgi:hypothetical protein
VVACTLGRVRRVATWYEDSGVLDRSSPIVALHNGRRPARRSSPAEREPAGMIAGALIAFGPALFGVLALNRWRRRITRHFEEAEVRSIRRQQAWEAVAEYDLRRAA